MDSTKNRTKNLYNRCRPGSAPLRYQGNTPRWMGGANRGLNPFAVMDADPGNQNRRRRRRAEWEPGCPTRMASPQPRSAYVHIPFCHRRCFYCDFPVVPLGDRVDGGTSRSVGEYLGWLAEEIGSSPPGPPLSTVYIGGGTPSLLGAAQVARLLALLNHRFGLAPGAEITMELDPDDVCAERLQGYHGAGVNRISLGAQSFDNGLLAATGRRHSRQHIETAVALLKAEGMGRWSLDLVSGLPGLTPALWEATLDAALALSPPHLSIYDLTIGEGTVFDRWLSQGRLCLPPETTTATMLDRAAQRLGAVGLRRYEISSYAVPGHACRHNRVYWGGGHWWGFGMGAASNVAGRRLTRPRTRSGYRAWLHGGDGKSNGAEPPVSAKERLEDLLITGLRRSEGVNRQRLAQQCALPPEALTTLSPRLEKDRAQGLLCCEGPCLRLSQPQGFRFSNQVLADCLLWVEELFAPGGAAHGTSLAVPA